MTSVAIKSDVSARFGNANALTCRECGASFDLGALHACLDCFGPLEVTYDLPRVTREHIEGGPQNIWRYAACCPCGPTSRRGRTPSLAGPS